jgi:tRNA dimethylallyltransferase
MISQDPLHRAFYLTGCTASGKTAVGVELARRIDAEIIALDSMTLYRGMNIGTAKPSLAERGGVVHHLIDVLDPSDSASVAQYRRWASAEAARIEARGKRVLFVGGTPLYLKALFRGLFDGPGADPALRESLEREADQHGDAALHQRLAGLDPSSASRLHPNDRRRIIRALEVIATTGRPLSTLQKEHDLPAEGVAALALERPRTELHDRINRRVQQMFDDGFVEEVRTLLDRPLSSVAAQAVGYKEVIDLLEGRARVPDTLERIRARTRQFAKRQATWFRGLVEIRPFPVSEDKTPESTARRLAECWSVS